MRRLFIACAAASVSACIDSTPPSSTTTNLSVPSRESVLRVPLVPVALATQADYDALEERFADRRGTRDLVDALKALAAAQEKPEPLLLQRIAVLVADDIGRDRQALDASLQAGSRLRDAAPSDPHALWFNGWVLWQFLNVSGAIAVDDPSARDLANAAIKQWKELLVVSPSYVGPRKHDAAQVRAAIARLEAALAEPATPVVTPPPIRAAGPSEIDALGLLARFNAAPDGGRRGICRDWRDREPVPVPSSAELRVDLACATLDGVAERALPVIERLRVADGPAFDACAALARLRERVDASDLQKALAATPIGITCP